MNSIGSWLLERSDGIIVEVEKPGVAVIIGRDKSLPVAQRLDSRYISRQHLSVEWKPPSLFVRHIGRNPTFHSMEFLPVPGCDATSDGLEFRPRTDSDDDTTKLDAYVSLSGKNVVLVQSEIREKHRPLLGSGRSDIGVSTLHFPEELGLPQFTVRHILSGSNEGETVHSGKIPSVPQNYLSYCDSDEEDEEGQKGNERRIGTARGWKGILDSVLVEKQKQQQDEKEKEVEEQKKKEELTHHLSNIGTSSESLINRQKTPPAMPMGQSDVPEQRASKSGDTTTTTTTTKSTTKEPRHSESTHNKDKDSQSGASLTKMGSWEWKSKANGRDDDPRAWSPYPRAVAELLEAAYREGKVVVEIPDTLMFGNTAGKGKGGIFYSICLGEASLKGAMIQFQRENKHKYRLVRRRGGSTVDRRGVSNIHILRDDGDEDTEEEEEEEDEDEDEDESSSEESYTEESSSSSEAVGRKRRRR
ncbi:hypothetical protein DQ04_01191120 [Trypanosoma grayi]|uniref:hypothetical protein n=1 Tax=Trypanosoma grayi TaxID=71804 RepID=UPI0004F3F783|nr:hypothetical protein DQ04_01191120 [Trypanosoma grayi]KEG13144.1 hypothetical protein DQ04_01191120 [Trypanosoma grayi]